MDSIGVLKREDEMVGWHCGSGDMSLNKLWETVEGGEDWCAASMGHRELNTTK